MGIVNEILWGTVGQVATQSFYHAAYDTIRKSTYVLSVTLLVLSPDFAFSEERAPEQGRISRYMKAFKGYGHFLGRVTLIFLLTTLLSPLSGKGTLTFRRVPMFHADPLLAFFQVLIGLL